MIKQTIIFNSQNKYFAGYIQFFINKSGLIGSVDQDFNKITVCIDDSSLAKVDSFSKFLTEYLPHSIFLDSFNVENNTQNIRPSNFISESYRIRRCKLCIEECKNICDHYSNQEINIPVSKIKNFYESGDIVVIKASSLTKICNITESELKLLFSIEKPVVKVTIVDPKLIEITGKNFMKVKIYDDSFEIIDDYVFESDDNNIEVIQVKDNISVIKNNKFPENLDNLNSNQLFNRFLNIKNEANFEEVIGINFDTTNISFLHTKGNETKEIIAFQKFELNRVVNSIKDKNSKLYKNFAMKFPDIIKNLESYNDLDFFSTISLILNLDQFSFETLSDKSCEFRGNGGMKLDTYFDEEGFDYRSFIASVMVFLLAESRKSHIAYSVFESLADMGIYVANQLSNKLGTKNFIVMGDIFSNNILYGRILTKFSISKPFFSKMYALSK